MKQILREQLATHQKFAKRKFDEQFPASPYRTEFQRDRDRILYSNEFRRLSGKTQVFLPISHDHVRTRLTHTLEVAQIARVTAWNLNLDENLAEAIALGRDIGHTPFGHIGERTLNYGLNGCDELSDIYSNELKDSDRGFKHNLQSLRVICDLDRVYGQPGLNLTNFTLWGIKNHTKSNWPPCRCYSASEKLCYLKRITKPCDSVGQLSLNFYKKYDDYLAVQDSDEEAWSFEAFVVNMADEISQRHHDVEDALHMKIMSTIELRDLIEQHFSDYFDREDKKIFRELYKDRHYKAKFIPRVSKLIVGMLNKQVIDHSSVCLKNFLSDKNIKRREDFLTIYPTLTIEEVKNIINYPDDFAKAEREFKEQIKNRIINSYETQRIDGMGRYVVRRLVKAYVTNPRQLHDNTIVYIFNLLEGTRYTLESRKIKDIGNMRSEIDSPTHKSSYDFHSSLMRGVSDQIAGMTNDFALKEYRKMYGLEPDIHN